MTNYIVKRLPMQAHIGTELNYHCLSQEVTEMTFVEQCDKFEMIYHHDKMVAFFKSSDTEFSVGGVGYDYRITIEKIES